MTRDAESTDLSELEREVELEMDDELEIGDDAEVEDEQEADEEYEEDLEAGYQSDEGELDEESGGYAERFYELSEKGYESEGEADHEVNDLVNEMERDFLFGGLKKKLKSAGMGLLKKGVKYAAGQIPALQAFKGLTQLTRGNLKGMLASLAKAGIMSAVPGAGAALPALKALGFDPGGESEANRRAWDNYVEVSREAFESLAGSLHENADNPLEAARLATNAFNQAMTTASRRRSNDSRRAIAGATGKRRRRVVYLHPGESLVVKRAR